MADFLTIVLGSLLAPMTLFFLLGVVAGLVKSDLVIPEQIGKAMALYLMLAIGFKGGASLEAGDEPRLLLGAITAGLVLSFAIPVVGFGLMRLLTSVDSITAAAVAAHYGSVSVVTFVTAIGILDLLEIPYAQFMVAVVAVMETPAIISGLFLAYRFGPRPGSDRPSTLDSARGELMREILLNGSVVILVGSFLIGWVTGKPGLERVSGFLVDPFSGVLCLFLLDMGLIASRQLSSARRVLRWPVIAFALYMPPIGAVLGLAAATLVGLGTGSSVLLMVLAASASYIAVPAAMRVALPRANAAVYLTLSLGVTFPFNVLIGIPVYIACARWLVVH